MKTVAEVQLISNKIKCVKSLTCDKLTDILATIKIQTIPVSNSKAGSRRGFIYAVRARLPSTPSIKVLRQPLT